MRISTSKSETMVLSRKRVECSLGNKILPQVEEFKYLGVLFTSEGRMEREIDRRIDAASAVMWALHRRSGHVLLGGDPGENPGHVGEIMSLGWPGNASGSPRKS